MQVYGDNWIDEKCGPDYTDQTRQADRMELDKDR